MLTMSVDNMLDSCILGTCPVIALTTLGDYGHIVKTDYYNADTLPGKYFDYPVSFIEQEEQYNGKTALIFTVYERDNMPDPWK